MVCKRCKHSCVDDDGRDLSPWTSTSPILVEPITGDLQSLSDDMAWRIDANEDDERFGNPASVRLDAALFGDVMRSTSSGNTVFAFDAVQARIGGVAQVLDGPRVTGPKEFDDSALYPAVTSAHMCCSGLSLDP
jgi:hypothetical protein